MKHNQIRAIARGIIRNGSWLIPDASICTLVDIESIESLVMFPLHLTRCEHAGWGLECHEIMEERHNSFWFGQEAGKETVDHPTKWIKDWQDKRSKGQ